MFVTYPKFCFKQKEKIIKKYLILYLKFYL